jgi:hypothetical protein
MRKRRALLVTELGFCSATSTVDVTSPSWRSARASLKTRAAIITYLNAIITYLKDLN